MGKKKTRYQQTGKERKEDRSLSSHFLARNFSYQTSCFHLHTWWGRYKNATRRGFYKVPLRTVDTDLMVLANAHMSELDIEELQVALGTGKNFRYIPADDHVSESWQIQGPSCVPCLHWLWHSICICTQGQYDSMGYLECLWLGNGGLYGSLRGSKKFPLWSTSQLSSWVVRKGRKMNWANFPNKDGLVEQCTKKDAAGDNHLKEHQIWLLRRSEVGWTLEITVVNSSTGM